MTKYHRETKISLTDPIFSDDDAARAHFEKIRWPNGPICPHCGTIDQATLVNGKSHRKGMYQCNSCREPFSVMIGSVMERSHIPLAKWALAFHLMAASKKGVSAHQLHRTLGITYRSAWFLAHRIREAMAPAANLPPMGGKGKVVEVDETYQGKKTQPPTHTTSGRPFTKGGAGIAMKRAVVTLVERGASARSFHMKDHPTVESVTAILKKHVDPATVLYTDESRLYPKPGAAFARHETVEHWAGEYARGDVHVNNAEGFFGVFKRGMHGVYQHCGEQHLHRYLSEFDFRYSNRAATGVDDVLRTLRAIKGSAGKRLTYQQSRAARQA
jgi:transposase-like protein